MDWIFLGALVADCCCGIPMVFQWIFAMFQQWIVVMARCCWNGFFRGVSTADCSVNVPIVDCSDGDGFSLWCSQGVRGGVLVVVDCCGVVLSSVFYWHSEIGLVVHSDF